MSGGLLGRVFSTPKGLVIGYLVEYLGSVLEGLDRDSVRTNLWQGTVECHNLALRRSAVNDIPGLPCSLLWGRIKHLQITIPWTRIRSEPIVVHIRGIDAVFVPKRAEAADVRAEVQAAHRLKMDGLERWQARRKRDSAPAADKPPAPAPAAATASAGLFGGLKALILENLRLEVGEVHLRFEDCCTEPHAPYAVGATLHSVSVGASTANWQDVFVAAPDQRYKFVLLRLRELECYVENSVSIESCHSAPRPPGAAPAAPAPPPAAPAAASPRAARSLPPPAPGSAVIPAVSADLRARLQRGGDADLQTPWLTATLDVDELALCITRVQYERLIWLIGDSRGQQQLALLGLRSLRPPPFCRPSGGLRSFKGTVSEAHQIQCDGRLGIVSAPDPLARQGLRPGLTVWRLCGTEVASPADYSVALAQWSGKAGAEMVLDCYYGTSDAARRGALLGLTADPRKWWVFAIAAVRRILSRRHAAERRARISSEQAVDIERYAQLHARKSAGKALSPGDALAYDTLERALAFEDLAVGRERSAALAPPGSPRLAAPTPTGTPNSENPPGRCPTPPPQRAATPPPERPDRWDGDEIARLRAAVLDEIARAGAVNYPANYTIWEFTCRLGRGRARLRRPVLAATNGRATPAEEVLVPGYSFVGDTMSCTSMHSCLSESFPEVGGATPVIVDPQPRQAGGLAVSEDITQVLFSGLEATVGGRTVDSAGAIGLTVTCNLNDFSVEQPRRAGSDQPPARMVSRSPGQGTADLGRLLHLHVAQAPENFPAVDWFIRCTLSPLSIVYDPEGLATLKEFLTPPPSASISSLRRFGEGALQMAQDAAQVVLASPVAVELDMSAPTVVVLCDSAQPSAAALNVACGHLSVKSHAEPARGAIWRDYDVYRVQVRGCSAELVTTAGQFTAPILDGCSGARGKEPLSMSGYLGRRKHGVGPEAPQYSADLVCPALRIHLSLALLDSLFAVLAAAGAVWLPSQAAGDGDSDGDAGSSGILDDLLAQGIEDPATGDARGGPASVDAKFTLERFYIAADTAAGPVELAATDTTVGAAVSAAGTTITAETRTLAAISAAQGAPPGTRPRFIDSGDMPDRPLMLLKVRYTADAPLLITTSFATLFVCIGDHLANAVEFFWDVLWRCMATGSAGGAAPPKQEVPAEEHTIVRVESTMTRLNLLFLDGTQDYLDLDAGGAEVSFTTGSQGNVVRGKLHQLRFSDLGSSGATRSLLVCDDQRGLLDFSFRTLPPAPPDCPTPQPWARLEATVTRPRFACFVPQLWDILAFIARQGTAMHRLSTVSSRGAAPPPRTPAPAPAAPYFGMQYTISMVNPVLLLPPRRGAERCVHADLGLMEVRNEAKRWECGQWDSVVLLTFDDMYATNGDDAPPAGAAGEPPPRLLRECSMRLEITQPLAPGGRRRITWAVKSALGISFTHDDYLLFLRVLSRNLLQQPEVAPEAVEAQAHAAAAAEQRRVAQSHHSPQQSLRRVSSGALRQPAPEQQEQPPFEVSVALPELCLRVQTQRMDGTYEVTASVLQVRIEWARGGRSVDTTLRRLRMAHCPTQHVMLDCRQHTAPQRQPRAPQRGARSRAKDDGEGHFFEFKSRAAASGETRMDIAMGLGHIAVLSARWFDLQDFLYNDVAIEAAGTLLGGGGPPPDPGVRAVRKVNMRLGELSLMLFEAARGVSELLHWSFYGVRVEFDQDGPDKVLHFAVTSSSAEDMEAAEGAPHACVLSVDQPDMPSPRITRAALSGADDSGLISFVYRGGAWARRTAEHITEEATRAGLRFAQEFIVHLGRIRFVYRHALWWSVMQSFTYGPFQQLLMLGYTRAQRLLYAAMWDPKLMGKFIIDWEEPLLVMPPASASASHLRLTLSAMHIENHSRVTSGPGGVPRFTDAMLVSLRDMDAVSDIDGERCPVIKGAQGLATIERDLVLKDGDPYNNRTSLEFEEGLSVDLTAGQLGLLRDLWALNLQVWPEPPPAPDSAAASTSEQPPKPAIQGSPGSQRLRFRCPVFRARLATDPAAVASWPQDGGLVFHIKSLDAGNWHDREAPGAWGQEVRCGEIELRDTAPVSEEFRYLFRLSGPEREGALQLTTETRVEHDGSHTADSSVLVGRLDAALTPDRLLQLAEFCTTRSICPQVHISRRERERAAPPGPPPPEVSATSRFEFAGLTFELPFEHLPLARLVLTRSEAQVDHYPGGKMEARGSIGRVELLDCTQLAGARPCIGTEDEMSLVRFFYTSDPAPPAPPHPLQLPPPQPAPESGPELQLFAPAEQGRLQTPQETPLATPLEAPLGAEGQQQQGPESGALRRGSSLAALRPPALASLLPPRPKLPEYSQKANVHLSSIQLTVRQAFLTKLQGMLAQETMSTMTKLLELRRASEWVQHQAQRQMAEQQALLNLMVTVAHPRVLIPEIRPDGNEDNHLLLDLGEISLKNSLHDEAEAFYERFLLTVKEFNITCTGQGRTLQEVPLLSFPGDGFPPRPGEAADDGFVSMPTTAVLEELDDDEKCPLHIAAKRVLRHCHPLHSPTRDTVEWDSASVESLCPSSSLDRLDLATPSGTPVRFADPAAEAAPREPSAPREHESGAWPETPEEDLEWPMQGAQGEDGEGDLYEECGDLEEERQGEAPEGGDEDGEDLGRTLPQLESLSCFDYPPDLDVKVTLGKVKVVLQEFQWVQLMAIMQTNLAHSAAASDDADPFTPPTEPAAAAPPGSDDGGEIPSGADPAAESSEQDTTESSMRFRLSSEQIELDVDTFEPPADGADGPPTWTQRFTFSIHSFAGELAQCSATRRASLLLGTVRGSSARVRYEHEKGPAKALKVVGGRSTFGKRRVLQAPTKAGQQDEVPLIDVPQGCDRCLELAATVGPFSRKVSAVFSGPTLTVAPQLWLRLHDFFVLPVHQVLKVGPDSDDPVVIDRDTRLDRDLVLTPRRVLQVKAAHTQDCRLVANNFVVIDGQSHTLIFRRSKASAVPLIIIDDGVVLVIKQCVIHISGMKEPKQFDLEDFVLYKGPGSGLLVDPDKNMYGLQRSAANCLMSFNSATAWGSFNHSMIGLTPPAVDSHLSNVGEAEETDGKVATELRIRASMGIRLVDMWTAQQPALSRRRGSRAQPDRRTGALLCLVAGEAVLHRGTDSDGLVVTTSTISLDRFSVQREGVSRNAPSDMVDNVVCHVSLTSHSNNTEIGMVLGDVGVQLQYSDALLVSRVLQQLRQGTASDELMERKDQQQLQQAHQHHQHQQLQPAQNPAVQEAQKHAGRTFELTLQTRNCVVCLVDDSSRVHGTGVPLVSGRVTHVNFGLVRKRARRFKCTGNLVLEMNYFDKERMKWQRMLTPRELSARLERRGRGREGPELSLTVEAVCEAHISPALLRTAQRCSALSAEFAQAVAKGAAFVPQVKPTRLQNALCAPVKFTYDGMQSTCDRLTNKEFASTGATLHIELEDGNTFRVDTTKPGLMRPGWGLLVDVKDEEAAIIVSLKTDVVMHNELPCSFNLGNIGELPKGEAFAVQAELRESPLTLFPLEDKAEWSQVRQVSDNSAVCLSVDNLIMHHRSRPLQLKSESGDRAFHFCIHVERAGDCWGIYLRSPFRVVNLTGCLMKLCLLEHARVPHEFVRLEPGEVLHATAVPPWQRIALHGVLKQVPHQKSGEDGTRGPALQSCTKESKHFTVVRQRRIANRVPKGEPSLSSHLRLSENPSGPRGARGVEVWLDVSYSGEDVILSSPFWIINHTTQHLQVLPLVGHESDLETLPPTLARAGSEGPIAFGPLPRQGGQGGLRVKLKERTGKVSSPILMQTLLAEGIARFHEDQMFQIGYTTSFAGGVYGYRTRVLQLVPRWMFINRMKAVPLYIYVEWRDINSFTLEYDAPTPFYTAAPTTGNARDLRATVEVSRAGMEGVMAVKLPIDQVTEMVIPVHASVGTCFSRVTISRSMQTLYVTFSECTAPYQIANRTSEPIRFWQHNAVQPGDSLKRYGGQQLQQRAVQRSDIVVPSRHTLPFALADLLGHTALVVQAQGSVSAPIDLTTLLSARVHIVDDIWYELRPLGPTLEISVYSETLCGNASLLCKTPTEYRPINVKLLLSSLEVLLRGDGMEEVLRVTVVNTFFQWMRESSDTPEQTNLHIGELQVDDASPYRPGQGKRYMWPVVLHHRSSRGRQVRGEDFLTLEMKRLLLPSSGTVHIKQLMLSIAPVHLWFTDTFLWHVVRLKDAVNDALRVDSSTPTKAFTDDYHRQQAPGAAALAERKLQLDGVRISPLQLVLNVRRTQSVQDPYSESFGLGWVSDFIFSMRDYRVNLGQLERDTMGFDTPSRLMWRVLDYYKDQLRVNSVSIPGYISGIISNMFASERQPLGQILRIGDQVTTDLDAGLDVPAPHQPWRLEPGGRAIVVRVDSDGDPYLRSVITGHVSAVPFESRYVRIMHRPLLHLPPCQIRIDGFDESRPDKIEDAIRGRLAAEEGVTMREVVSVRAAPGNCVIEFDNPVAAARLLANPRGLGTYAARPLTFAYEAPEPLADPDGSPRRVANRAARTYRVIKDRSGQLGLELLKRHSVVHSVRPGGPAAEAEIRPGMHVIEVDGEEVSDSKSFARALASATSSREVIIACKPSPTFLLELPGHGYEGAEEIRQLDCYSLEQARALAAQELVDEDTMARWCSATSKLRVLTGASQANPVADRDGAREEQHSTMFYLRSTLEAAAGGGSGNSPSASAVGRFSPSAFALSKRRGSSASLYDAAGDTLSESGRSNCSQGPSAAPAGDRSAAPSPSPAADAQQRVSPVPSPAPAADAAPAAGAPNPLAPGAPAAGRAGRAESRSGQQWDGTQWHPARAAEHLQPGNECWYRVQGDWQRARITEVDRRTRTYHVALREHPLKPYGGKIWQVPFHEARERIATLDSECEGRVDDDPDDEPCSIQ